jgi:hypothetical protein
VSINDEFQKVYRADHQNLRFWANGFIRLPLLRETPFEMLPNCCEVASLGSPCAYGVL